MDNIEKEMSTMKGNIDTIKGGINMIVEYIQELRNSVARSERREADGTNQERQGT